MYSYEFHGGRAEAAREDFVKLGVDHLVRVTHRDACATSDRGFKLKDEPFEADAVFLDLPSPWLAIDHANAVLKPNGRLCSFSPCIEQVQRAAVSLAAKGFVEIKVYESLQLDVKCERVAVAVPKALANQDRYWTKGRDDIDADLDQNSKERLKTDTDLHEHYTEHRSFKVDERYESPLRTQYVSRRYGMQFGHTGYLLFCSKSL